MSLSDLGSFSYGPADFIVTKFDWTDSPIIEKDLGETGRKVSAAVEGYIVASTAADFAAKVKAADKALSQHGLDLTFKGLGGETLESLPAAVCLLGGPFCDFTATLGSSPLRMDYKIKIESEKQSDSSGGGGGGKGGPSDSYTLKTKTKADDLRQITRDGKQKGVDAADFFVQNTLPQWRKQWPAASWIVESDYTVTTDDNQSALTYTLTATETSDPLPIGTAGQAVSGTYTQSKTRDEQHRVTRTMEYDLLCTGDMDNLLLVIRPAKETILRESVQQTFITENRLRASFEVLESGSGTPLMNFSRIVSVAAIQRRTLTMF